MVQWISVRGLLLVKQAKPSVHMKSLCFETHYLLCTLVLPFLSEIFEGVVDIMKIDKVYNNNVVLAKGDQGEEIIVMGRGLGFQKKSGDEIEPALVEKTFVMQDSTATNELTRVYIDLSPLETEVVLDIIKHGQEVLKMTFDTAFYIALADHLHYTLQRTRENLVIQNPLSWEIRK